MKFRQMSRLIREGHKSGKTYTILAEEFHLSSAPMAQRIAKGIRPGKETCKKIGIDEETSVIYKRERRRILNEIAWDLGSNTWYEYENKAIERYRREHEDNV